MMQANWSIILNILLLSGVIVAIVRLMNTRKQNLGSDRNSPSLGMTEKNSHELQTSNDDIIAVRKVQNEVFESEKACKSDTKLGYAIRPHKKQHESPRILKNEQAERIKREASQNALPSTIMMLLSAKENRQFAGYELLQTVLAAGLRFGEGFLFHRHQFPNGQGSVLFSLAAATSTGTFDLQNIGAFRVRGLCLFMHVSKNSSIDEERFTIMLETAKQLSEGLDAHLLDSKHNPLTAERISSYYQMLQIEQEELIY